MSISQVYSKFWGGDHGQSTSLQKWTNLAANGGSKLPKSWGEMRLSRGCLKCCRNGPFLFAIITRNDVWSEMSISQYFPKIFEKTMADPFGAKNGHSWRLIAAQNYPNLGGLSLKRIPKMLQKMGHVSSRFGPEMMSR